MGGGLRLASALLIVVGSVFVGVGGSQLARGQYVHDVVEVSESDVDGTEVMRYGNLSKQGQSVVKDAVESENHETRVRADQTPLEFEYDNGSESDYVTYDGQYYRVVTTGPGFGDRLTEMFSSLLCLLGFVGIVTGGFNLYRHRTGTG